MGSIPVREERSHDLEEADRCPVGAGQRAVTGTEKAVAQARPRRGSAALGRPEVFRGDPVDPLDGGPVERIAPAIWVQERRPSRLQRWTEDGTLEQLWRAFLAQLQEQEHIRWNECFVDGTFASAKKGGFWSARPSAARARSLWYWLMARGLRSDFTWTRHPRRKSGASSRP